MKRKYIVILAIILVIGFASVTTTLVLNGKVGVGVELDDFDVIFTSALLNAETSNKVIISENKKTITFNTDKLINKGDTARLDYKVKNTSTQYNADVEINCTNEANEYISVISEFDGNQIPLVSPVNIKAGEVKSGYINAELIKTYAGEDTSMEIKCSIVVTATSRETYAYSLAFNSNGGSSIEDKSVILNNEYGELEIPVKVGYNFLGWYDEEDNKVDESTILDSKGNRTLYAKWEEKEYPVTIKTNEHGTSESTTLNVPYGKSASIKITPDTNYYISSIECSNGYTLENYDSKIPVYREQIINIRNNKVDKEGSCTFSFKQGIYEYGYTGGEQSFVAPLNGEYKIELWGAGYPNIDTSGGAYVAGSIDLTLSKFLYVFVGSSGDSEDENALGGYNGGGNSSKAVRGNSGYGGSGATDVRLVGGSWNNFDSLKSRIIVAGASSIGVAAGGLTGYRGIVREDLMFILGYPGSQISGGAVPVKHSCGLTSGTAGGFGYGGLGGKSENSSLNGGGSGGGSGYYGGSGAGGVCNGSYAGGGGSSFISGHNGCDAIAESSTESKIVHTGQSNHYSGYVFKDTVMIDGAGYKWTNIKGEYTGMPTHDGKSTMTGNSGNGYAKITLVSID